VFLRSWLLGDAPISNPSTGNSPNESAEPELSISVSPPPSDPDDSREGDDVDGDDRNDTPPAFPALSSAQRLDAPSRNGLSAKKADTPPSALALPKVLTDTQLMPPPPLPSKALRVPGVAPAPITRTPKFTITTTSSSSSSSSLALPPSTNKVPGKKFREKVALAPGFGPLDWAALKTSGKDLRGVDTLVRVTPSMLKEHRTSEDAWTAINGKVYNITPYLPFHPGGEKELMRVAGRDGTKLFSLTHSWVNVDMMLDSSLVGFLVSDS